MKASDVIDQLQEISDPEIARHSQRFFKTGKGEYGEGDKFLGVRVPKQRAIAKRFKNLPLPETKFLLESVYHEIRLTGLLILVYYYKKASIKERKRVFDFYLKHLNRVNNWDLVDSTASHIAGHFIYEHGKDSSILLKLSKSESLWKRRVAIIATFYFIDKGEFRISLNIAESYLDAKEDLIHKATGWVLREIGKKDIGTLISFLDQHCSSMPRTMLRYAIEKLDEPVRQSYLKR
jgi:3-methyladenine DNA glycosylase AlkD